MDVAAGIDIDGVCLSGGGIRAAAFGLGALQALEEDTGCVQGTHERAPADYLVAVSGGSYIAGAMAMLRGHYPEDPPPEAGQDSKGFPVVFAPGSDEVEFIRRRAQYLLNGDGGATETVIQFAVRLLLNLAFVALPLAILGRIAGWLYGWAMPDLPGGDVGPALWPLIGGGILLVGGFLLTIVMVFSRRTFTYRWSRRTTVYLIGIGVIVVLIALLPVLISAITACSAHVRGCPRQSAVTEPVGANPTSPSSSKAGFTALIATVGSILTALAAFRTTGIPAVASVVRFPRVRQVLHRLRHALVAVAATIFAPIALGALVVWMAQQGSQRYPWHHGVSWEWQSTALAVLAFVLLAYFGDPTTWSLHPFYKRRLMSCFCLEEATPDPRSVGGEGGLGVTERDYHEGFLLSKWQLPEKPELLIAAAANISAFGAAPAGQNVLPFVLSAREIRFSNGRRLTPVPSLVGNHDAQHPTGEGMGLRTDELALALANGTSVLRWRDGARTLRDLTLPTAVAISGAAFSPSMGKLTIPPIRMLLGLFNLRLGVWLPNPGNPRVRDGVAAGKLEMAPSALYLLREYLGRNSNTRPFVYVSDGGHYENLGLVELLRRECKEIWCIDASGDAPGIPTTLAEAMRLAETELGVTWDWSATPDGLNCLELDSDATKSRSNLPTVRRSWTTLAFSDRDGKHGRVHVVKSSISEATPPHLQQYQQRQRTFPYDATGNQLFRADRFDAYRELGYHTTKEALRATER